MNYSIKDNTSFFSSLVHPNEVSFKNGPNNLTIKLNSVDNDPIILYSNDSFSVEGLVVSDILVTASGISNLTLFSMGWK